jgi:hypothetical protein
MIAYSTKKILNRCYFSQLLMNFHIFQELSFISFEEVLKMNPLIDLLESVIQKSKKYDDSYYFKLILLLNPFPSKVDFQYNSRLPVKAFLSYSYVKIFFQISSIFSHLFSAS